MSSAYVLAKKLASYFKLKSEDIQREFASDPNSLLVHSTALRDAVSLSNQFYCVHLAKLNVLTLLNFRKLEKSPIMEQFLVGEGAVNPARLSSYIMSMHIKGSLWFMYRAVHGYGGLGGIYTSKSARVGLVFEPCENYLHRVHPANEIE